MRCARICNARVAQEATPPIDSSCRLFHDDASIGSGGSAAGASVPGQGCQRHLAEELVHTQKRVVIGFVGAAALAAVTGTSTSTLAQSATVSVSSNEWNTFVADVTVTATRVKADGTPAGIATAPLRYRWERSQSGAGWKTVMTIAPRSVSVGAVESRRSVENPFAVVRIEDDEDGSPLRMYARNGKQLEAASLQTLQQWTGARPGRTPAPGAPLFQEALLRIERESSLAPRPFTGSAERDWIGAFVATPQQTTARRARLTQQFMRAGQIRGLDRFTRIEGIKTHEILADPQSSVPVEVNVLHDGQLMSHTRIGYQPGADGSLVRQAVHVEQVLSSTTGERAVTNTEYANVRVERRR
jgi:hypothetical protein